jgi:hypothetical protein
MVENIRGAYLQSRHLLMALELGEPFRILRAIAAEAAYRAAGGTATELSVDRLLASAESLARDLREPYGFGFTHLARGIGMFLRAHWAEARVACEAAEAVFEKRPIMASWELASARMFSLWSCFMSGDFATIRARVPVLVREAEARGDLYAAICLRLSACNLAWLIGDEPGEARRQLVDADARWSHRSGVQLQHYWSMMAWVHLDLYEGASASAYERTRRIERGLRRSLILRIEFVRVEFGWVRARAALALAQEDPLRRPALLKEARADAARLLVENAPWARAIARVVEAGVLRLEGWLEESLAALRQAATAAEHCGLWALAIAARDRLGEERPKGAPDPASCAVARPDRWAALMLPGFCP